MKTKVLCHVCPEAHHTCNFDFGASQRPSLGDMKCEFLKASQSLKSHAYSDYTFPKQAVTIQDPPMAHTASFSQGQHQTYVSYEIHFDPTVLS